MMTFRESIRPSADLRNHYNEISRQCRENKEAVVITVNGRGDTVSIAYEEYRRMRARIELLEILAESEEDVKFDRVAPDYLAGKLYSAICDSYASEVAMRRNAMDSATKNADAMISDLRLRFNRARQGAITQEITEIVAGAEE